MDFLRTLVEARKAQNFSQQELAGRLGRPQSFVSKYERGERRLDVVEFLHVARILGLSATDIIAEMERKLGPVDRPAR
jgi:transcriptional regulator with XRE-family HTH domain